MVGRPNVTVLLDMFHMNIEEVSMGDAIRLAGKRLGYLHVVDSNRRAPGWGHISFDDMKTAVREIGYDGWLTAEVLPIPDSYAAAKQWRMFYDEYWSK